MEKTYTVVYKDGVYGNAFNTLSNSNCHEGDPTPTFEGSTLRTGYTFTGWTPDRRGEIIYTANLKLSIREKLIFSI